MLYEVITDATPGLTEVSAKDPEKCGLVHGFGEQVHSPEQASAILCARHHRDSYNFV